jgi:peptide/nickel transport system substrate-binding protein
MEDMPPRDLEGAPPAGDEIRPPPAEKSPRRLVTVAVVAIVVAAAAIAVWYVTQSQPATNSPPTAVAVASATTTSPGTPVEFNAESSWDLDGQIVAYSWDFGDGAQGTAARMTHAYSTYGSYIAILTVTDNRGATANNDVYLIRIQALPVSPPQSLSSPPVAVILTDGNARAPGTAVSFDGSSSWEWTDVGGMLVGLNGPALSYNWDLDGDGVSDSTAANPTHSFAQPGNFPVELTVTSSTTGLTATTINTIRILGPEPAYSGTVPNPNVYTHVLPNELSYLDPARDYAWPGFNNFFENIYEHLVGYDRDDPNTLVPVLAERIPTVANGGISPDGLNYTFRLRSGIPFHCGGELTAADVEYTFDRLMVMNLPDGPAWEVLEALNVSGTNVLDAYTIRLTLWRPYAPFLKLLTFGNFGIMSRTYVIANGGWNPSLPGNDLPYDGGRNASGWGGRNDPFMESHTCGTGPYQLVEWNRGLSIRLSRFVQYWQGAADIETVIIQLASEFNTRLLLLRGGQADAVYMQSDLQQVAAVRALRANGFRVVSGNPTFSETAKIHLNQQIDLAGVPATDNIPANFFQDVHVRKAFNYAVSRQAIIDTARSGQAVISRGPIPPTAFGYASTVPTYDLDLALAEQELRAALAPDGQSWWDKGFRLTAITIAGFSAYSAMLLNLKDNLESINPRIQIDVQELDLPAFFQKWVTYGYAVMSTTMYPEYGDPHTWLGLEATSFGFISKFMGVPDTLDALVASQLTATDPSVRASIIGDIQQELYDLAWYVWIDYTLALDASSPWVKGYYYHPLRAHPPYYALSKE